MGSIADFVGTSDKTYAYLLKQIRTSREFPYIATSLAKLLSREEDFVRGSLGGTTVKLPLQKKGIDLDFQIILGIYYMLNGKYEEAQRHFFEARDMSRGKELTFALTTVGSNIFRASTIYNAALSYVKPQIGPSKK